MMEEKQNRSLLHQLEGDFVQEAQSEHDEVHKKLEALAAQHTESVTIYDGAFLRFVLMIMGGMTVLYAAVIAARKSETAMILLLVGVGAALILAGIMYLMKRNKPLMTLTAKGILVPGMDSELPWTAIYSCDVEATGLIVTTGVTVIFNLNDPGTAPTPRVSGDWRVQYNKRKHLITARAIRIKGIKPDAFADLLDGYLVSGNARAALKEMEG